MNHDLLKLRTLGELRRAGYQTMPVRLEMRQNVLERLRAQEKVISGIIENICTICYRMPPKPWHEKQIYLQ